MTEDVLSAAGFELEPSVTSVPSPSFEMVISVPLFSSPAGAAAGAAGAGAGAGTAAFPLALALPFPFPCSALALAALTGLGWDGPTVISTPPASTLTGAPGDVLCAGVGAATAEVLGGPGAVL